MAEQKVLSKLSVLARAFQREEVQPLVAVAVLAVKTAPGTRLAYSLCSKVLNTCRFLGRGVTCFSGGSGVNDQKLKAIERCQAVAASVKDFYSLLVSKQRALWNQYHCPEQVLNQTVLVCCYSLGVSPT